MLAEYSDISSVSKYPYHHHTGARALKAHFETMNWRWSQYTSITTIRNPWDRVVSIFHYGKRQFNSVWHKHYSKNNDFHSFISNLPDFLTKVVYSGVHLRAGQRGIDISEFAYSTDREQLVDHILPIETIENSLPEVLGQVGLPKMKFLKVNCTKHEPYQNYYDESLKGIVAEIFENDIDLGGYSF